MVKKKVSIILIIITIINIICLIYGFIVGGLGHKSFNVSLSPIISNIPLLAGIVGLIPNCAVSIALTMMLIKGTITFGTAMSGLLANSGLGLLVLLKYNDFKDTLKIIIILLTISIISGLTINLSGENTDRISSLKSYYDRAVVFAVISVAAFLFFFIKAAKRKRYQSFLYGALGGIFLTLLNMIRFFVSGNPVIKGVRDMVIHKDYSFFDSGDGFTDILPPNLALNTALFYIMAVLALAGVFVLIRLIIRFINRPHRF